MAIDIMENYNKQTASEGNILTNGVGDYSYEVYSPPGIVWQEVEDKGQLNGDIQNISEQ